MHPSPTRAAALARLSAFAPRAGHAYASQRNEDRGPGAHDAVSRLSPWLRHRSLTEPELLRTVLGHHSPETAEKFVQEVFWRTYFKGWLERRPSVYADYRRTLARDFDALATQEGLRRRWEAACKGETGIACFDAWARELVEEGYLHNHARMWFASIWIFTLDLPWALGADFFIRHLFDGDPASNTLGWRWIAGLQTPGKTYLARPDNIARHTGGRFRPAEGSLATQAPAVEGPANPPARPSPGPVDFDPNTPTAFILHEDDLSPDWLFDRGLAPLGTAVLNASARLSPLTLAPQVLRFRADLAQDAVMRHASRLGLVETGFAEARALADWAQDIGARQIVTPYAPTGAVREVLEAITGIPVIQPLRSYDLRAWPHAQAGFFRFRKHIPELLAALDEGD